MWLFNNRKKTEEKKSDRNEMSDILNSYCLDSLSGTLTDLSGSDVWADIEKCDRKFRKSYFIEAQGLKQLQEKINDLESERTKLSNLRLNNTQNYIIISEKIQKAKEILKERQQLETRIDFKNNIEGDRQYKFISFDDFANILKSYDYSFEYKTIDSWTGLISEKTIDLLQYINYMGDGKGRNYIYAYRTENSPITSVVTCDYTNRIGIIRSYGYLMKGQRNLGRAVMDAWLGTDSLEYKIINRIEDKKIYIIPSRTTKLQYHRLVDPEDIADNPIFPNTKKQVKSLGTDIVLQVEEMSPRVPLIAISENYRPLIFQTWCDGVIVYGFIENEHI